MIGSRDICTSAIDNPCCHEEKPKTRLKVHSLDPFQVAYPDQGCRFIQIQTNEKCRGVCIFMKPHQLITRAKKLYLVDLSSTGLTSSYAKTICLWWQQRGKSEV